MNLVVHVAVLVASVLLRLRWGGVEAVFFVFTVVGPVLMLVPTILAFVLPLRPRAPWPAWVSLAGMSAGMLVASLCYRVIDVSGPKPGPVVELLGLSGPAEWANQVAQVAIWSFPVFLVWALVAMFVFNDRGAARVEKSGASIG